MEKALIVVRAMAINYTEKDLRMLKKNFSKPLIQQLVKALILKHKFDGELETS